MGFTLAFRGLNGKRIDTYGMDGPGIESRWKARFSAPVQTGPGTHPASYTLGIAHSEPDGTQKHGRGSEGETCEWSG